MIIAQHILSAPLEDMYGGRRWIDLLADRRLGLFRLPLHFLQFLDI
jgi:hypothetical protein